MPVKLQEHAKKMRAMAAQAEAQKGMEPDHPVERWNLVILSENGPRYRGLAKGEIGEVISSKYKVREGQPQHFFCLSCVNPTPRYRQHYASTGRVSCQVPKWQNCLLS